MEKKESRDQGKSERRAERTPGKRQNMHDNIGFWCDCCSCEAEPLWQELAEKLGIDLSGREDDTSSDAA